MKLHLLIIANLSVKQDAGIAVMLSDVLFLHSLHDTWCIQKTLNRSTALQIAQIHLVDYLGREPCEVSFAAKKGVAQCVVYLICFITHIL